MNIMKRFLIIVLFIPTLSSAQNFLKNLYTKTPTQITEMTDYSTNLDSAYFTSHFGTYIRDIVSAILQRGYSVDDFASFSAAVTAAATDSSTVVVSSIVTVSSNVTVPRTVGLAFMRNGRLNVANGSTLTLNGPILQAGRHQIFDTTGTIYLNGVDELYPEWFGARSDSTINCTTAFQKTIDAASFGATIRLAPATGQTRAGSKGYIINNTVTIRGNNTQVHLMGAGTVIHSSGTDTVFVITGITPGGDSFRRAQNLISGIRFEKKRSDYGKGVAIALVNATEQSVRDCHIVGFNNGFLFLNENSGWCEHNHLEQLRFIYNDTSILFNAKGSGTSSFRNNHLEHIAASAGGDTTEVIRTGGQAVIIATIGTGAGGLPNVYQNTWINVSMALGDSITGVYIGGRANNLWGQVSFENFGGQGTRSRAFHFGPNATNLQFWIYTDFATRGDLEKVIFNESGVAPQHIFTHTVGQSNAQERGLSAIWDDTHQFRYQSIISADALSDFSATPGDTQVVWEQLVGTQGIVKFRTPVGTPPEFHRVFRVDTLGPIRAHNIGRMSFPEDTTTLNVGNTDFIQFAQATADIDTVKRLIDSDNLVGRKFYVLWHDSMVVTNLNSGTGRIFWADNRDRRAADGMRSLFVSYGDGTFGGITWREMFTHWPMGAATWNVDQLTAGSTDSVMVGYYGAEIGDPVVVGLSSILTANANFDLKGHVVKVDSIRVYATNRSAGTYDLASGTLRYKIVR